MADLDDRHQPAPGPSAAGPAVSGPSSHAGAGPVQRTRPPKTTAGLAPTGTSQAPAGTTGAAPASPHRSPAPLSKEALASYRRSPQTAATYAAVHLAEILAAVREALASAVLPTGSERLQWARGAAALAAGFEPALLDATGTYDLAGRLSALLHPADLWLVIDQHRPLSEGALGATGEDEARGPIAWDPLVGLAVAAIFLERMRESLDRLGPRYVVQSEQLGGRVAVADLVTSHPFDRVTARLLCQDGMVRVTRASRGAKAAHEPDDPSQFRHGIRVIQHYEWQGRRDPALWNWIKVVDLPDATPEEVAAILYLDAGREGEWRTDLAHAIVAAPPFFAIPARWARQLPGAAEHAPAAGAGERAAEDPGALALAASELATDAAIAQGADERKTDPRGVPRAVEWQVLAETLDKTRRQLHRMGDALGPWRRPHLVGPALAWATRWRDALAATPPGQLVRLAPAIDGQQEVVFAATGDLLDVLEAAAHVDPSSPAARPFATLIEAYATALGTSHLVDTARAELAIAQRKKALLPLELLDRSLRENQGSVQAATASGAPGAAAAAAEHRGLLANQLELRAAVAAGQPLDAARVETLAVVTAEHGFRNRVTTLTQRLQTLKEAAWSADAGGMQKLANLFAVWGGDVSSFPPRIARLQEALRGIVAAMDEQAIAHQAAPSGGEDLATSLLRVRRDALGRAEQQLAALVERERLEDLFRRTLDAVEDAALRQVIVEMLILIGVSVAGGLAGRVVAGLVGGALLADTAAATASFARGARAASTMSRVAGLAADAAVNAAGQTLLFGDDARAAFVENLLSSAGVLAALAPLKAATATWGHLDERAVGVWERVGKAGKVVLRRGAVISVEMITAAAVGYVTQRLVRGGPPPSDEVALSWALQGASMAIGRAISGRLQDVEDRLEQIAAHAGHLLGRVRRVRKMSDDAAKAPSADAAMELIVHHNEILAEEARLLADDRVIRQLLHDGVTHAQLDVLRAGNARALDDTRTAAFEHLPLRLAGLTPDDPRGSVWAGTSEQIEIALHQAHRAGLDVRDVARDPATRQWQVRLGDHALVIHETTRAGRARASTGEVTPEVARQARRRAEAAAFLQAQHEARLKADLEARAVIELDHLQVGFGSGGVTNQDSLHPVGDQLVVYMHTGAMSERGELEIGQRPPALDGPGVRTSEQTADHDRYLTSAEFGRAVALGRFETQAPGYRGEVVAIEPRPAQGSEDWAAPQRAMRVRVRSPDGVERWFYTDRLDYAGGAGPPRLGPLRALATTADLAALQRDGLVIPGDDPAFARKIRAGAQRILVWGGGPAGAWAAEDAIKHGAGDADFVGDVRGPQRAQFIEALRAAEQSGDPTRVAEAVAAYRAAAHTGQLPRNTKPGGGYNNPQIHVEMATPTKLEPTGDGRVRVVLDVAGAAEVRIYDQVVTSLGQDVEAPGGPSSILGAPDAEARILLRPIIEPDTGKLVGLESIEPPGIRLLGAASASRGLLPWIEPTHQDAFIAGLNKIATEDDRHHVTGRPVTPDSRRVTVGVEAQSDRIPLANEVLAVEEYRLPGPRRTLTLDRADPERWDEQVAEFLAENMRGHPDRVRVERLGTQRADAPAWRFFVGGKELGVFKLLPRMQTADTEAQMLRLLAEARIEELTPVRERGVMGVDDGGADDKGALLTDAAPGQSIEAMIRALPEVPRLRREALEQLQAAVARAASGLAALHRRFASGATMSEPVKRAEITRVRELLAEARPIVGEPAWQQIQAALPRAEQALLDATLPATAYHGDATAENLFVDGWDAALGTYKDLAAVGVGDMARSIEQRGSRQVGMSTGAADVGTFLQSLESGAPGTLTASEVDQLNRAFTREYFRDRAPTEMAAVGQAQQLFRVRAELDAIRRGDRTAVGRIIELLDLPGGPP